jgi:hypothetical protein
MVLPAADAEGVPFDGGATVGFHNQYNFRGFKAGERAPSLAVDFLIPVSTNSELALNVGEWYINPAEDGTDEFGLYTFLVIPVAGFNFRVGGTFFAFPERDSITGEFGATVSYSVANYVDLELAWWSDVKGDGAPDDELRLGHYIEFSVGKFFELKNWLGVEVEAGISYGIDYYGVDGLNHTFGTIGFPIGILETTTLTPYVGGTLALEGLKDAGRSDQFVAGISLSVGF